MNRVEAKIVGGLGNQMFIAAASKSLALRLNATLYFDLSAYHADSLRNFDLSIFNIDFIGLEKPQNTPSTKRRFGRNLGSESDSQGILPTFKEKGFEFDQEFQEINSSVRLEGYFQSWKYFEKYINEIADLFAFPTHNEILEKIQNEIGRDFIVAHVRRGDYLNPSTREFHGLASDQYFFDSIKLLKGIEKQPVVAFTDSAEPLSRDLAELFDFIVYPSEGIHPAYYMGAMKAGQAFVISNSTFSWWPAFLSTNPKKVVVAPRPWFANADVAASDLLPQSWITLGAN